MSEWRNWQTRQLEVLVPGNRLAGSSPASDTGRISRVKRR